MISNPFKSEIRESVTMIDPEIQTFVKMIEVGVPRQAVINKMLLKNLDQSLLP